MADPLLFTPMSIRDIKMKNRVVVAPMHQYAAENGFPTDWHLMNIGRFAAGGAGLVFVESTKVDRRGCGTCLLYTSPSPRDRTRSRMPSSA